MDNKQIPKRPTQYIDASSRANYGTPAIQPAQPDQYAGPQTVNYDQQPFVQNGITDESVHKNGRRTISLNFKFKKLQLPGWVRRYVRWPRTLPMRIAVVAMLLLFVASEAILILGPHMADRTYALSQGESLLPAKSAAMEKFLSHNTKEGTFTFNPGYNPMVENKSAEMGPKISATAYKDPMKGLSVVDPVNDVEFSMKPKFPLLPGEQNGNRVVYPLKNNTGWLVYTMQGRQVKEDILLRFAKGDRMSLKYEVSMNDAMEMRLEKDGSIGVYGTELPLYGNISTGTDKDKELLQKARQKAPKNKLLFTIPAPVIVEYGKNKSDLPVKYVIDGNEIKVEVSGLKKANYPLSIDPSVYVTSAQQFMRGNNESNIDFDTSNELIQKSKLTGARIKLWNDSGQAFNATTNPEPSISLSVARWNSATVVGGGYAYVVGGNSGSSNTNTIYWAQFDTSDSSINSPNPGSTTSSTSGSTPVTCSGTWCTNSAYNLPANRAGLSAVVYNGYIYAIGGVDASCATTNNVCDTVYYSKIGANGEPIGWNTTSSLGTARRFAGAVVYKNKIYVLGGQTSASLNGSTSVESADIRPDGTLSAWTTTGMTVLPTDRWGATFLQNNGFIYMVGGANGSTAQNTVHYIGINSNGTLTSTWVPTTSFANARMTFGGSFATIYGNYLYITSGCATLTTSSCSTLTSTTNDFQLASLNADGTITNFTSFATPLTSATNTAMTGYGLVAWRGALYGIGGCTAVSAATTCSGTAQTIVRNGKINTDGDVSTVQALTTLPPHSAAAGTSPFGGRIAMGVVVNNGFIYIIGGCDSNPSSTTTCDSMTPNTSYAAVNSDGTLSAPSACTADGGTMATSPAGSYWCVNNETLNGTTGLGAFGVTVYNNVIYTVGGRQGPSSNNDYGNVCRTLLNPSGSLSANFTCAAPTGTQTLTAGATIFTFARAAPNSSTNGNIYMIGGCTTTGEGIGCNNYLSQVLKCTIPNSGGNPTGCTTTGQQQLRTFSGTRLGTGIAGGVVYGNYVYLAGGANSLSGTDISATGNTCDADLAAVPTVYSCGGQLNIVQYAKIDASGNITKADGTVVVGTGNTAPGPQATWNVATGKLTEQRRRTTAFAINGYLYVVAGHNGTAPEHTLNDIQRGKIDVNTGNIASFDKLVTTVTDRWDLRATQANGYIYLMGGCTTGTPPSSCTAMNGTAEFVQIYNNWSGSPAAYTSSTNRPANDRYGGAATVLNGYLYLAGGCTSTGAADCVTTNGSTMTNNVSYAPLNADGSLGTWVSAANSFQQNRAFGRLVNAGGTLYYIGGVTGGNGTPNDTVFYSTPDASGAPAAWASATNGLPTIAGVSNAGRAVMGADVYDGRIYVTGGISSGSGTGTPTTTVAISPNLSTGGDISSAWTGVNNAFQIARSGHVTVAYGGKLYVMGGFDGTNYLMDVQYMTIDTSGPTPTLSALTYGTTLPQAVRQGDGFATNGFIYVFGGRSSVNVTTNNTYIAPLNADGSIGTWSQTSVVYTGSRFGLAAAYLGGRAYILGGASVSGSSPNFVMNLTSTNNSVYATMQLQPQIASYSLMVDTDTNVFPSKYLINGKDGGIGASWFLKYISSTTAANSWGQVTNTGRVTLGTPGIYTPRDGAGVDTNTTVGARYYMFMLDIDVQQAFGFPEDISRGPNIDDVTLLFTSDPAKRLLHGKTFVGGQQQPLDTPF